MPDTSLSIAELARWKRSIDKLRREHEDRDMGWLHMRQLDNGTWDILERGPVPFMWREMSGQAPFFGIAHAVPFEEGDRFIIEEQAHEMTNGEFRRLS